MHHAIDTKNPIVEANDESRVPQTLRALNAALDSTIAISGTDNLDAGILTALAKLGDGIDADRAYIFKNIREKNGIYITSQVSEWTREGVTRQLTNPTLQETELPLRWTEAFMAGKAVSGFVDDFPLNEKTVLAAQQIQSVVVVPIFNENRLWGFMGFDAVLTRRRWSATEESLLRIASLTLGMSFARMLLEKEHVALEEKNRQIQRQHETILEHMAGSIAHIFNNQLCVIMGTLDLLEGEFPPDSPYAESIQLALKASRQCAKVSDTMLVYLGQAHDRAMRTDIIPLCKDVAEVFSLKLPRSIHLSTAIPSFALFTDINAVHFQEVLQNVLTNSQEAIDHEGEISLVVSTYRKDEFSAGKLNLFPVNWMPGSSSYISIVIMDTGIGIDESALPHVCDPFYTTKFQGRGLGLSMVVGYLKSWNGAVSVESQKGVQTKITLYLPLM